METPTEPIKTSFPTLSISLDSLMKNNKNVITDWLKTQLQKLSPGQCGELLSRCTQLLQKPEEGKEHTAIIDGKWKPVGTVVQGDFLFNLTSEVKGDSEFKLMLIWATYLKGDLLREFMKEIVDFIPKAKPHAES